MPDEIPDPSNPDLPQKADKSDPESPPKKEDGLDHPDNDPQEDIEDALTEEVIPEEIKPMLRSMPAPQRQAVVAILAGLSITKTTYRGPLPPPEMLEHYNAILPGCAERIVGQFEKQSNHRMDMEKQLLPAESNQARRGQSFALIIVLSFLLVAGFLIHEGHDAAGSILGGADLAGVISVFIVGKYFKKKEDKESE